MDSSYWTHVAARTSRRRFLQGVAVAGSGLAGAALIGCGGGEKAAATATAAAKGTGAGGSPVAAAPRKPVRGGTLHWRRRGDPPSFKITQASSDTADSTSHIYSQPLTMKQGPGVGPLETTKIPDMCVALPEQPDSLTYIFKIKPGIKFANVKPVNGRVVTSADVVASIKTVAGGFKADYPTLGAVTAPDANTVIVKTTAPYAPLLNNAAGHYGWRVAPEDLLAGKSLDTAPIGSGPYILESFQPGAKQTFVRNPDYFDPQRTINFDKMEFLIIPQVGSVVAAFRTGDIDILTGHGCNDSLDAAKAVPKAEHHQTPGNNGWAAFNTSKKPFDDVRVRKAMALLYNRPAEVAAIYCGKSNYQGMLPQPEALDAKDAKTFPESANLLKRDVAQAKSLLSAAGYKDGFKTTAAWTPQYGQDYQSSLERYIGDVREAGITVEAISYEYGVWIADVYRGAYKFDGILFGPGRFYPDVDPYVAYWLHPTGIANQSRVNNPALTALIDKQRGQMNPKERWDTLHQIQKMEAENVYYMWREAGGEDRLSQPWLSDYNPSLSYGSQYLWNAWDNRLK